MLSIQNKYQIRPSSLRRMILIFICLFALTSSLTAQEQQRKTKVGLVLSGGGAKGMAHIGIIRALEENGIPIDYIAGTSAGAIIGGLYAAGYTTSEMESIFISPEFNQWLRGSVQEQYVYFFKKNPPTPQWIEPSLKIDSSGLSFQLPTNLISPLQIDYEFMTIFSGAEAIAKENFDSLFIPFRCAAANLNTQKPYYFNHGDLGKSIRASMTFPFLFKPIIIDSIVFFDGGMYDNFPVKVVQEDFNPDIIIGSKVGENFPAPKDGDLLSYLQKMIAQNTEYTLRGSKGIILVPELDPAMNIINFDETCEIVSVGYKCAIDAMDSIKSLVKDSIPISSVEKKRDKFRAKIPPLLIDTLIISGVNDLQEKYITRLIGNPKTNTFSIYEIKDSYFRLFSDENIQYIYPSLHFDTLTNKFRLSLEVDVIDAIVPKIGGYLAVGGPSEAFLEVSYRRLRRVSSFFKINTYLGNFYNSINAYNRFDFPARLLPFYTASEYTFNKWDYFDNDLFQAENLSLTYLTQYEQHIKIDLGFPLQQTGKISFIFSLNREEDVYKESEVIQKGDKNDKTIFNSISLGFMHERNTLDKPQYASKGFCSKFIATGIFGREYYYSGNSTSSKYEAEKYHRWAQLYYNFQKYGNLSKLYNLGISIECSASWQDDFLTYPSTLLHANAFYPTAESRQYFMPDYRANFYVAPGIQNVLKLYQNFQFRLESYVFIPFKRTFLEYNNLNLESQTDIVIEPRFIVSTGFVFHSPIGSVSLLFNYHQRDNGANPYSVIFNIGYVFFNKRGYKD